MAQRPKVIPDAIHLSMWRVQWPDGSLSDMANLTRAKDAAACFMETEERRQRGRQRPLEGRRCVTAPNMGGRAARNEQPVSPFRGGDD